jgi:hypothetical protein
MPSFPIPISEHEAREHGVDLEVLGRLIGRRPRRLTVRRCLGIVLACGLFFGLAAGALRLYESLQDSARCNQCAWNLKQIVLALHNYNSTFGRLPPAYTTNPQGSRLLSWRVLILPYMGSSPLYSTIHLDEPWNGPNNRLLHGATPPVYCCPNHPERAARGLTSYLAVIGADTAFPTGRKPPRLEDFAGRTSFMPVVVESNDTAIHWMEPRDMDLDTLGPTPTVSSRDRTGPHLGHMDGSVGAVPPMTADALRTGGLPNPIMPP